MQEVYSFPLEIEVFPKANKQRLNVSLDVLVIALQSVVFGMV